MTDTNVQVQQQLAAIIKERAVHLTAEENFKERKKELNAEMTELLGKGHGKNLDLLATAYIRDQKKVEAAKDFIDRFEEASAEVEVLGRFMTKESVDDLADKYMEV
jgi:hypothetical protein